MSSFSDYMDKVKAEESLKKQTADRVRAALADGAGQQKAADSGKEHGKKPFWKKKLPLVVSSAAACAVLILGSYAYARTPVSYVSVDINPSVELGVNAFGRVVHAEAYNSDGTLLLQEASCTNLSVEDSVNALIRAAAQQGYVAGDGTTVIAVTAESKGQETAAQLQTASEAGVRQALNAEEKTAVVYSDCTDLQLRTQAQAAGVSPGKLRLIRCLQTLDPRITIEECADARITDLITRANELMLQAGDDAWQSGPYADSLARIQTAAQQVQARIRAQTQNAGTASGAQQGQDSGQVQGQNQNGGSSGAGQTQNQGETTGTPSGGPAQETGGQTVSGSESGFQGSGSGSGTQTENGTGGGK